MTPPLVELVHAGAILKGRRVLRDLNWTFDRGCHWAVFGDNGAGKTTFLRLVAGQQWPAPDGLHPRCYDFGAGPEYDAVTARRRMRLVGPELHDRYPLRRLNATVATIVATGLQDSPILRVKPNEELSTNMRRLARRLGIASLLERRFLHLSRGQQRKVLIARALVANPDVLLLDEICEGLDQRARTDLLALLDELCADGLQLVMATHHRDQLPACINRYIELDSGRIVASWTRCSRRRATADAMPSPAPAPRSAHSMPAAASNPLGPSVACAESPLQAGGGLAPTPSDNRAIEIDGTRREFADAPAPSGASRQPMPPDDSRALIEIINGDLYRGIDLVLQDVTWQLLPGQHWRITGPNASGKSTFLKLLYGDLRPARGGEIRWFGSGSRVNIWRVRREIGLISDELQSIYGDDIAVAACVATGFNASIGRVPLLPQAQITARDSALEKTELTALRNVSVRLLSYGQFRRVLLARALVQEPRVLLLDEPMSGLDADSRALIWRCIADVSERGTQLVMASHERDSGTVGFSHELRLADGRVSQMQL